MQVCTSEMGRVADRLSAVTCPPSKNGRRSDSADRRTRPAGGGSRQNAFAVPIMFAAVPDATVFVADVEQAPPFVHLQFARPARVSMPVALALISSVKEDGLSASVARLSSWIRPFSVVLHLRNSNVVNTELIWVQYGLLCNPSRKLRAAPTDVLTAKARSAWVFRRRLKSHRHRARFDPGDIRTSQHPQTPANPGFFGVTEYPSSPTMNYANYPSFTQKSP